MIKRILQSNLEERLFKGKALIILGPRQTGKTTLMNAIASGSKESILLLDCDEPDIRERLTNPNSAQLQRLIGRNKLVLIDEAQRVENIGITLKLITDKIKDVQLIVSGSSALELSGNINETLTGRKYESVLYPFSVVELCGYHGELAEGRLLEQRLVYGLYPDVVNNPGNEQEILKELVNSYLYKDILLFNEVRKPHILPKLLKMLALQVGSEVSINELSRSLEVNKETVERYIDLLEKSFIVYRLSSFSRNIRSEINRGKKIFFFDNGIRNALVSNFNDINLRTDVGALWENFLITERLKQNAYRNLLNNSYFWRTTNQQEIDYIEEHSGKLFAFEFKWNPSKKTKVSQVFVNAYPDSTIMNVNRDNYWDFITME